MTLLAPAASLTDLLLSLTAFAMAWTCLRRGRASGSRRLLWWSLGYGALGLASFVGFINLGFTTGLGRPIYFLSRLGAGVAVLAMISAVTEGLAGLERSRPWRTLFLLALGGYFVASLLSSSFLTVIAYSGTTLVATLALEAYRWLHRGESGAMWMALGMATAMLAAVLQAAKLSFTLGWTFDHNAIYHLVMTAALFLFYRGLAGEGATARQRISKTA